MCVSGWECLHVGPVVYTHNDQYCDCGSDCYMFIETAVLQGGKNDGWVTFVVLVKLTAGCSLSLQAMATVGEQDAHVYADYV